MVTCQTLSLYILENCVVGIHWEWKWSNCKAHVVFNASDAHPKSHVSSRDGYQQVPYLIIASILSEDERESYNRRVTEQLLLENEVIH